MTSSGEQDDTSSVQRPEELQAALAVTTRRDGPLQLGDFEIDDDGRLRPRAEGAPIAIGFSYRGVDFLAKIGTGGNGRIQLSAELGKLPYRAEGSARRDLTRRVIDATAALPRGQISLSADQDMRLCAEMPAPATLTPGTLMAALTAVLLDFKPYIDLLHEVMLTPDTSTG